MKIHTEVIRPFSGDGDVVAWIQKVKLVAKLQKVSDLASFMPLFLEGEALSLYLEMKDEDRSDADRIEQRLKGAFTDDFFFCLW